MKPLQILPLFFLLTFHGSSSLASVNIPESLTSMDWAAFSGCINLIGAYIEGDAPDGENAFGASTSTIVYHRADATGWGLTFAGRPTALWIDPPRYDEWIQTTDLPPGSTEFDDPDQDNMDNRAEMLAGTSPTDGTSLLAFELDPRPEDLTDDNKTALQADEDALFARTIPGKTYAVQWAESPTGPWNVDAVVTAQTTQVRFVMDRPEGRAFYRVIPAQ